MNEKFIEWIQNNKLPIINNPKKYSMLPMAQMLKYNHNINSVGITCMIVKENIYHEITKSYHEITKSRNK